MLAATLATAAENEEKKILVLLSALVERFGVSRMRDFFSLLFFFLKVMELLGGGFVIKDAYPI